MEGFKRILFPIALTDMSPKIAPYVTTMAKKFEAELHLLHVLRRFDWFVNTYVSDPPKPDFKRIASDFEGELLSQAHNKLKAYSDRYLPDLKIANKEVVSGTHYRQIIDYAKSKQIDLIIMGTGTKGQKMMFGSVADKVSRLAKMPVMLIKLR